MIKQITSVSDAQKCDELLTKLIQSEREFNDNIRDDFVVTDFYPVLLELGRYILFGAFIEGKIVGYTCVKINFEEGATKDREAILNGIYVEEEYRNQHIAKSLIHEAKKWCKENQIKYLTLHVYPDNLPAIHLYREEGFSEFAVQLKCNLDEN